MFARDSLKKNLLAKEKPMSNSGLLRADDNKKLIRDNYYILVVSTLSSSHEELGVSDIALPGVKLAESLGSRLVNVAVDGEEPAKATAPTIAPAATALAAPPIATAGHWAFSHLEGNKICLFLYYLQCFVVLPIRHT